MAKVVKSRVGVYAFTFLALELIVILIFLSPQWIQKVATEEDRLVEAYLGQHSKDYVSHTGWSIYRLLFIDTGIVSTARSMTIATPEEKMRSRGMEYLGDSFWFPLMERLGTIFYIVARQATDRVAQVILWGVPSIVILIPATWAGINMRKLKQFSFSHPSTLVQNVSYKILVFTVIGGWFLLLFPSVVHPLVFPVMMMGVIPMAWMLFLAHLPKKL